MTIQRPRATGFYAVIQGREFHATIGSNKVILRSYSGESQPANLIPSRIPGVQGIRAVDRRDLDRLTFVNSICLWHNEPFMIVGVHGGIASVFYTGGRGEWALQQPGMVRTGKLETHGQIDLTELSEIHELVNPIPL